MGPNVGNQLIKNRIETLDYLRGIAALSIMFYHLISFNIAPLDISSWLGRLGVYAVSLFFILSGLSMAVVYNGYIKNLKTSFLFYIRRAFRIWPLLFIVTSIVFIDWMQSHVVSWKNIIGYLANITGMFGFIRPGEYMATGAWSIGNEMVYYAFTPLIIFLFNKKKFYGNVFLIITIVIAGFFAFSKLNTITDLSSQWNTYINPFNNFFFFVGGIAIYYNLRTISFNKYINYGLLISAVMLFCFIPIEGNSILIVTDTWRVVFSILCFTIVIGFYKLQLKIPQFIGKPFELFGIATYGVYLLHPVINRYLSKILEKIIINSNVLLIVCVSITTIAISLASYYFIEIKIIKIGKKFCKLLE